MAGNGGDVKLLGAWQSPFTLRARIALKMKGVEYEFAEETMEPKSELLLQYNPIYKKIPVLVHGGRPLCESAIIVQYIDDAWTGGRRSIVPADPYDRALARFWAHYIDDQWYPAFLSIKDAKTEEAQEDAVAGALEGLRVLEEAFAVCSKGNGFFGGDAVGYLDIVLGCFLGWLRVSEELLGIDFLDGEKTPMLARWAERFRADESVKGLMPETNKLIELVMMLQA